MSRLCEDQEEVRDLRGALLFPATFSLINTMFAEGHQRNRALAVWSVAGGAGAALGSLFSGVLVETFGWEAVFFVNVPLAGAATVLASRLLPHDGTLRRGRMLDLPTGLTATAGVTLILSVFVLVQGPASSWTSRTVVLSAAAAMLLLTAFGTIERHSPGPLKRPALLRKGSLRSAMLITLLFGVAYMAVPYLLTEYLQEVQGYTALETGFAFLLPTVLIAAGTLVGERMATRIKVRATLLIGNVIGLLDTALLVGGRFIRTHRARTGALGRRSGYRLDRYVDGSRGRCGPGRARRGLGHGLDDHAGGYRARHSDVRGRLQPRTQFDGAGDTGQAGGRYRGAIYLAAACIILSTLVVRPRSGPAPTQLRSARRSRHPLEGFTSRTDYARVQSPVRARHWAAKTTCPTHAGSKPRSRYREVVSIHSQLHSRSCARCRLRRSIQTRNGGNFVTSDTAWARDTLIDYWSETDDSALLVGLPAQQQPDWPNAAALEQVRNELACLPGLVTVQDVRALRSQLAEVAAGKLQVVQSGDCAEDPAECIPEYVTRKVGMLDALAGVMRMRSHKPVIRVGRIAGQFAKPRSRPMEQHGAIALPVFRGHMVNKPEPDRASRVADPQRLLSGYWSASAVMNVLGALEHKSGTRTAPVWTSHEALLLDYEVPMLRRDPAGRRVLTSTHWPWIGERTRQVDGAHVALLATVSNPVACKVGPAMSVEELLLLCERLDPDRELGRLTLIARMGAAAVAEKLPPLVSAVRAAGHPVIWLCDPMHGNTIVGAHGLKTRAVNSLIREVVAFQAVVGSSGGVAGGLHLETTPDDVTECVVDESCLDHINERYTSLCDPRLNPLQALAVAHSWAR